MTPQYLTPRDGVVTLGDGQLYGGYLNYGPLNSEAGYQVAVAVTQSLGGESRVAVSDLVHIYTIYLHYLQVALDLLPEDINCIMSQSTTPYCPICTKDCANFPNLRSHLQVYI